MNNTEQTAAALNRQINQLRAEYFHCMNIRAYDLAEQIRLNLAAACAAYNSLSA